MKSTRKTLLLTLPILILVLACGSTSEATPASEAPMLVTSTPVTGSPSNASTATPTDAVLAHELIPVDLPKDRSDHAGDYNSSSTAQEKRSNGGDRFSFERFERPFNAGAMDIYFPELDIVDSFVYEDNLWIYGALQVVDRSAAASSPYRFAMQLDIDVDGKGDFLVLISNPTSDDWTTNGVQVFFDANSDVGDLTAMFTDEGSKSDGFESMVFDTGIGDDPDMAWARVSPEDPNTVEIAVKRSALGNTEKYMVDLWAGHALLDAALFDFSDHFTHVQAGAADTGLPNFYPIKALYEIDNTCRMAVGFQPTGYEPGVCEQPTVIIGAPGDPTQQGTARCTSTPGQIFACSLNGGTWNSSTCTCLPEPTPEAPR